MDGHGRARTNTDGMVREYAISQDPLPLERAPNLRRPAKTCVRALWTWPNAPFGDLPSSFHLPPSSLILQPPAPVLNPQSAIPNTQPSVLSTQSSLLSPQSAIPNTQPSVLSTQSSLLNPQSAIRNPQSPILSPQHSALSPIFSVLSLAHPHFARPRFSVTRETLCLLPRAGGDMVAP
jgi:hypothetical protein